MITRSPSHLPEPPSVGIGTFHRSTVGLPRFHRAGPSTSLDKSAVKAFKLLNDNTTIENHCQTNMILFYYAGPAQK
jgi:hypothetical protein